MNYAVSFRSQLHRLLEVVCKGGALSKVDRHWSSQYSVLLNTQNSPAGSARALLRRGELSLRLRQFWLLNFQASLRPNDHHLKGLIHTSPK